MPLQLGDHLVVDLGEAFRERSRTRCPPQQLVEPVRLVPGHAGLDGRPAEGVVPFSVHHLAVASIDEVDRTMVANEYGGLVRTWNHTVTVSEIDDSTCRYEDRIDIDAGPFTALVVLYASVFYRYRQRRWKTFARLLAAAR